MPTIREVALRAGVGLSTASRVLRGQGAVSDSARRRVERAAGDLGYVPDRAARTLRGGRSHLFGLLLSYIDNPLWAGLTRAVEDAAYDAGFHVILGSHRGDPLREREYVELLIQNRAEGVVILPTHQGAASQIQRLRDVGIAAVLVGSDQHPELPVDRVWVDNAAGAYELTQHLIEHGHRRIGAIHGPPISNAEGRALGFARALSEAGLSPGVAPAVWSDWSTFGGYRAAYQLLADPVNRPTALFVANNNMVVGALVACRELGLRVPDDVALVNFDDIEVAAQVDPFLTVTADPIKEIGEAAIALLLDRIEGRSGPDPRGVILPTRCILRRSCGCRGEPAGRAMDFALQAGAFGRTIGSSPIREPFA